MERPDIIIIGGTTRWVIHTVDVSGIEISSTNTITYTKNGAAYTDFTETRNVIATGREEIIFTPNNLAEGDIIIVREVATVASGKYENLWTCTALSPENTSSGGGSVVGGVDHTITVQDNEANAVSGATINIFAEDGTPLNVSQTTESDGSKTFSLVPDTYIFSITSLNGYETLEPEVHTTSTDNPSTLLVLTKSESTVENLDLTGIKRVKTKHMEIEAFDPRIMQEARDKENNALPCFGDVHFCKGKYSP